jgi:hypothetical protein
LWPVWVEVGEVVPAIADLADDLAHERFARRDYVRVHCYPRRPMANDSVVTNPFVASVRQDLSNE